MGGDTREVIWKLGWLTGRHRARTSGCLCGGVMKRIVPIILLALAWPAAASQPGEPLDCTDWTLHVPGITCSTETPLGVLPNPCSIWVNSGGNAAIDNEGYR